jgi:hypothetical protein
MGFEPKQIYPEVAALASTEEKEEEEEDTPFKDTNVSNSNIKIPPNACTTHNKEQSRSNHEPVSCSVCTEHILDQDNVRILPCAHIYHQHCIDRWLLDFAGTCPLW